MSDLGKRLAVAAVGIPISVAVARVGGPVMAAGLGVLAALGVRELAAMAKGKGGRVATSIAIPAAAAFPMVVLYWGATGAWALTTLILLEAAGYWTLRIAPEDGPATAAATTAMGAIYVGGLLSFGIGLRETILPGAVDGTLLFFLPVAVTWLADTAAYFGGRAFGRRPMAPRVSPNKTVEGGVFGLLAGPIGVLAYATFLLPGVAESLGAGLLVVLGFLISAAAILGDLSESALKRECGVKDSSNLLPGHGGVLDRLDSLLWSIPVAYLFLAYTL